MEKVVVIKDTREQQGYTWEENDWCDGFVTRKLDTGDYSLDGYENILCVERKFSTAEIAINSSEKRFQRELERMSKFEFAFIVCEFTLEDVINFPVGSGIPTNRWDRLQVTGKFLLKKLTEYQIKYGVHVMFCGNKQNAWQMTNSIFKRVIECKTQM